jgi:hypothetical protein
MLHPNETLIIDQRFCGPPEMGNGGYVSGLLARRLTTTAAEVTLYRPAPLGRSLTVSQGSDHQLVLNAGDQPIATAGPVALDLPLPKPPTYAQASATYLSLRSQHPFPACFVCGPDRARGDGLNIFPGPVPGQEMVAAPWTPDPSLVDDDTGAVRPEFVWAALDCPGGIAAVGHRPRPILLGRLAVRIDQPLQPEQRYVVIGWPLSRDGRKHITGTAIFSEDGRLCAQARAIWIEPKS